MRAEEVVASLRRTSDTAPVANGSSLTSLYHRHGGRVYTYCLRVTGSRPAAIEALAATFASLRDHRALVEEAELYAIARPFCLRRIGSAERAEESAGAADA